MEFAYSNDMNQSYQELLKQDKKVIVKKWIYISSAMVVPTIFFFLFFDRSSLDRIFFYLAIGLFMLFWIITLFINLFYVSESPYFQYFYPQVINDINQNEPVKFLYQPYPSQKNVFNNGNLFPLFSTKQLKLRISFVTKHKYGVDVYDAKVTNSGFHRVTYLNGFYFIIKGYHAPLFQIRSFYNPFGKTKYKRLSDVTVARTFVAPNEFELDDTYLRLYNLIKGAFDAPSVIMSSTGEDLYIGITMKNIKRKYKKLDEASYNKLRMMLMQIVDIANLFKPNDKK